MSSAQEESATANAAAQPANTNTTSQSQVTGTKSLDYLFPEMLDVMEFESSWSERGTNGKAIRRYMLVLYFPAERQFQVTMDDSKTPLSLKVINRYGEPLHAYDLYVGAVLDILGRPTTLQSASLRTIQWLEGNTRRLWGKKMSLEEKVNKFRPMPLHALNAGVFKRLKDANVAHGGTIPNRKIAEVVQQLEAELSTFQ